MRSQAVTEARTLPTRHTEPDPIAAGARIRSRRQVLGISQASLAKALGVSFQQVHKYEMGVNRVSAGRLVTIAAVLEVPISFFFETTPPTGRLDRRDNRIIGASATSDEVLLLRAVSKIANADVRSEFVSLVKAIAGENGV
jgi:transcriptional regulator with XRE-family HTH domain